MATQSSSVLINIQMNLRGSNKLTALNAALKELKTNIIAFQRSMGGSNSAFGKWSATADQAARNMKMLQQANTQLSAANERLSRSHNNVRTNVEKLTRAQMLAIQKRKEELRLDMQKIAMSGNLVTRLKAVEVQYDAIFRAGYRLQMLGNDMEQLGRKVITSLAGMASEFGDFEFMLNRAAGAMGILRTEVDKGKNVYDAFQGAILDTANELKLFNPEEVAKATYYWASTSGQQVDTLEDMERALKAVVPIMKVAALTETSYETAIKGTYSILTQYGKGIDEVADVTEKLNMVSVRTAAEFPDLINSFKMVGPIAAANNVTFEEMVDLFGKLADAGIRGTMSGRGFRQLFIQLVKPSEKAAAVLDDLFASTQAFGGKSYMEMTFPEGSFIGPTKYIENLATATKDLTQEQRNSILAQITTANELPIITALVNKQIYAVNTQADAWAKAGKDMRTPAQVLKEQWEGLANSWNGLVGGLQRGIETIRIQIGQRLAIIFGPVIEEITRRLGEMSDWFEDERNGPMIDFFVKLTGAAGGLLVVAGFATKLAGALTALSAASMVALKAFGPLLAKVSVVGGLVAGFVAAVSRNFDYLKDAIVSAFEDITEAFGGGEGAVKGAQGAFEQFSAATRPIFDFVVRSVADLIRSFGSLISIVAGFGPARALIETFGKALIFVFAARTIGNVLGLTRALGMFTPMVGKAAAAGVILNNTMRSSPSAMGAFKAGIGGIKGALTGLKNMVGPGGVFVLIATGLGLAYENIPAFKEGIDRITYSFKDFKKEAQEAMDSLGLFEDRIGATIQASSGYITLMKELEKAQQDLLTAGNTGDVRVVGPAKDRVEEIQRALNEYTNDYVANLHEMAAAARAAGADVSLDDISMKWLTLGKMVDGQTSQTNAIRAYFTGLGKGSEEGADKIAELTKAWETYIIVGKDGMRMPLETFLNFSLGNEGVIRARAEQQAEKLFSIYRRAIAGGKGFEGDKLQAGAILAQLVDLRDSGNVSEDVSKKISDLVNGAFSAGIVPDPGEFDGDVKAAYGELSNSLLSQGKALLDIDTQLAKLMKESIKPKRQVAAVIKSFLSGWISKGFRDSDGHFHVEAQLFAQQSVEDLGAQYKLYLDQLPPAEANKFITSTIKNIETGFKNGVPKNVPPELKSQMWTFITGVYESANRPVPQSLIDSYWGKGKKVPEAVGKGIKDNKGTAGAAAGAVYSAISGKLNKDDNIYYNWGYDLGKNFVDGIKAWYKALGTAVWNMANLVANVLGHSTPKEGPLVHDDMWGAHLMQNIIGGVESQRSNLLSTIHSVANDVATGLDFEAAARSAGISVESNASRVLKVEVEVTSPDGSVNKMTTAQLESSIMTSDLILSLEHMAVVG